MYHVNSAKPAETIFMSLPNQKTILYLTEPDVVDSTALHLLESEYLLIQGDLTGNKNYIPHIRGLIIRTQTKVDHDFLNKFPELEAIIRIGVGMDNIDILECQRRHIELFNAPGSNAHAVAEYVIGMILTGLRKWHHLTTDDVVAWNRSKYIGSELHGKTVGIIGFGNIGRLVYQKLVTWGCNFIVYDPYLNTQDFHYFSLRFVSQLEEVLQQTSIITLHVPLSAETLHLLSFKQLTLLPQNFMLVNAARGGIVDEAALKEILIQKHGTYIGDVFENEPLVDPQLVTMPEVIATPHIAAMTEEANTAMAYEAIENYLEHRPLSAVNAQPGLKPTNILPQQLL